MLNVKPKVIAIAVLAIPAALAGGAQASYPIINPEDSGYFGPMEYSLQWTATDAPRATVSTMSRGIVNPQDSGYFGPVAQEDSPQRMASTAPRATRSMRLHEVINPEDSGYFGPIAQDGDAMAAPAGVAGPRFTESLEP